MIRQSPGDLLEIEFDGKFYYVVVLTKIVMFGGNIIFAFQGDGSQRWSDSFTERDSGFNICSDLSLPKREGVIRRLCRFPNVSGFWRTRLVKTTLEWQKGHKAKEWYIYAVHNLQDHIEIRTSMPAKYASAMDDSMYSFDLVAAMILNGYTPEQNPFL